MNLLYVHASPPLSPPQLYRRNYSRIEGGGRGRGVRSQDIITARSRKSLDICSRGFAIRILVERRQREEAYLPSLGGERTFNAVSAGKSISSTNPHGADKYLFKRAYACSRGSIDTFPVVNLPRGGSTMLLIIYIPVTRGRDTGRNSSPTSPTSAAAQKIRRFIAE